MEMMISYISKPRLERGFILDDTCYIDYSVSYKLIFGGLAEWSIAFYLQRVEVIALRIRILFMILEGWLSGRKRFTANEVGVNASQGFESLTLRKKKNLSVLFV